MDSNKEIYEVEFTEDCRDEIREIYEYISKKLVAKEAARRLMAKMRKAVMDLAETPKLYAKIITDKKRIEDFRKIVIDNYVILYMVDDEKKTVYISHMYYGGRNYL